MTPPIQNRAQKKPKPSWPQPQKPPPMPVRPMIEVMSAPVMPVLQRPAPASWVWIRPSGSGSSAQPRPYRRTPMPANSVSTMKMPRTIRGSMPILSAMPLETPPIQRSRPRCMPWLRIQSKKFSGWAAGRSRERHKAGRTVRGPGTVPGEGWPAECAEVRPRRETGTAAPWDFRLGFSGTAGRVLCSRVPCFPAAVCSRRCGEFRFLAGAALGRGARLLAFVGVGVLRVHTSILPFALVSPLLGNTLSRP